MVTQAKYALADDADSVVADVIAASPRGRDWGNARSVRIMVEAACEACDVRIDAAGVDQFTGEQLVGLTAANVQAGSAKAAAGAAWTDGTGAEAQVRPVVDDGDMVDAEVVEDGDTVDDGAGDDVDWLAEAFDRPAKDAAVRGAA